MENIEQQKIYIIGKNTWIDKKILDDGSIQETRYLKLDNEYFKPYIKDAIKEEINFTVKDGEEIFYKNGKKQSVFWIKNFKISPEDFNGWKEKYDFKPVYSSLNSEFNMLITLKHKQTGDTVKVFNKFEFYNNYKNIRFSESNRSTLIVERNGIQKPEDNLKYKISTKKFPIEEGRKIFLEKVKQIIEPEQIENYQVINESGLNINGQNEYIYISKYRNFEQDEKIWATTKISFENETNLIIDPSKNIIEINYETKEDLDVLLPYNKPNISIEEFDKLLEEKMTNFLTLEEIKKELNLKEEEKKAAKKALKKYIEEKKELDEALAM